MHTDFGGTPGFLEQVRTLLADPNLDVDALRDELEGVEPGVLAAERQAYYDKIVTSRLYAALSTEAQRVAVRLALSVLPLPVDAVAPLADLDEKGALRRLDSGVEYGLLQRFDAPDLPSLFQPPGLLRPWLTDAVRLPERDAAEMHRRLAAFWQDAFERDREAELRVGAGLELEVCRHHARLGDDSERWCWAAVQLAWHLEDIAEWRRSFELIEEIPESKRDGACWYRLATIHLHVGDYAAAREKFGKSLSMLQAIGDKAGEAGTLHQLATIDTYEGDYTVAREKFGKVLSMRQAIADKWGEATTLHNLASIDLSEGDYAAAREKFGKSLSIKQAIDDKAGEAASWHQLALIDFNEGDYAAARKKTSKSLPIRQAVGDRAGEAASWHQLASIDLSEGDYAAAREKFGKSLSMRQAIGEKAGEASTLCQLAIFADKMKRTAEAAQLMATSWLINKAIGHSDKDRVFENLSALCGELGYDQTAFDNMLRQTWDSYQKDGGHSLLKAAFPDWPE